MNKLTALLRMMKPGDVIFLPYRHALDTDVHSRASNIGVKVSVSRWIAARGAEGKAEADNILRIEMKGIKDDQAS